MSDWHAERAKGIGGSDIAAVVGLSPWKSAFSLWHEKKGNIPAGDIDPELAYWGNTLEAVIADRFAADHTEYVVAPGGTHVGNVEWARANPDRLLHDHGDPFPSNKPTAVLEIKTARFPDGWGKTGTDEVPIHYRCQVAWYMHVLDVDTAHIAVLIGGSDYREYTIPRDRTDEASLLGAAESFWQSVQADDEPPLDVSDSTYQTVRKLHDDIDEDRTEELAANLVSAFHTTKQDLDHATEQHRLAKTQVLAAMQTARTATCHGLTVFRRQPTRGGKVALYPKENV